jgi:hypothetical protein
MGLGSTVISNGRLYEWVMKKTNGQNQNCSFVYKKEVGGRDEQNQTTFAYETKDGPMRLL